MTNPPHDGDERGPGGPQADPDQMLTQPVQPYERPSPSGAQPSGQPTLGQPPGPGQSPSGRPRPYGPPPGSPPPGYGQPSQQPWSPPYGQPGYGAPGPYGPPQYGQSPYGPSSYGPPAYGPQHGAPGQAYGPPQKSKVGLIAGLTGLALLLIAGVVVTIVAMRSTVLDPVAVERDVAAQFEQREGVAIDLTCADEMEVDEGDSYRCTGVTADGEEVTLQITITDEETAAYTWTEP